jgi:hypothetical protein
MLRWSGPSNNMIGDGKLSQTTVSHCLCHRLLNETLEAMGQEFRLDTFPIIDGDLGVRFNQI